MSEQNRRLRAAGIAALAWAGLAAVWCVLVPGGAAELPQGVLGTLRSLLVLPLAVPLLIFATAACQAAAAELPVGGYLAMLAAFLTASATLCPFATAAALRLTVR